MGHKILLYQSISTINTLTGWVCGLVTAGLILRCTRDLFQAFQDDETGLKEAFGKIKKRIFAAIIALTITSLVTLFKRYYN